MGPPKRNVARYRVSVLAGYALLAVVFCHPLWRGGFPDSHERLHHLVRVAEIHDTLAAGDLYARWCPNLMAGYGLPLFNYYAPLAFYGAEALHALGLGIDWAVKGWYFLATLGAALAFYWFARGRLSRGASHVAAVAYLFAPYHISNITVRGNLAEYTAMALLPLALGLLARLGKRPNLARMTMAGAALAALILSHNITALTGCALAGTWAAFVAWHERRTMLLGWFAGAGALGLGLSAFFWLPALRETGFIHAAELTTGGNAIFRHFVYPWQLFDPRWGFGVSVEGPGDTMSFQVGLTIWIAVAGALIALFRKGTRDGATAWFFLAVLVTACVLMMPIAAPLYRLVSLLQYIQFPWRLLAIATVAGAWLAGFVVEAARNRLERRRWIVVGIGLLMAAGLGAPYVRVPGYMPIEFEYAGYNTRHYFIDTVRGEYTPPTVREMPSIPSRWRLIDAQTGRPVGIERITSTPTRHVFRARHPGAPTPVFFEVFDFPGWSVYWDGKQIPSKPSDPNGLISFTLPGPGLVEIAFEDTPVRRWSEILSLLSLAAALGFVAAAAWQRFATKGKGI